MTRFTRQLVSPRRPGFTLVELLVVMAIFVILATLSLGAWRGNENDRIGSSAATFKNALEGARSRAIKAREVRGLRLLRNPNDVRIVTGLAYVGPPGYDEGNLNIGTMSTSANRFTVTNAVAGVWGPLGDHPTGRALIKQGCRIEIPRDSGNWYHIVDPPDSNGDDNIVLSGFYRPSTWIASTSTFSATPAANIPYRLQLSPALLPGDPILLGAKTCIDLDGSKIPGIWRGMEDLNGNGTLQQPNPEQDRNPTGSFDFSWDYSNAMDILFSPQGTLIGDAGNSGMLNFVIADPADCLIVHSNLRSLPLNGNFLDSANFPDTTYPNYLVCANPEHPQKVVSIFPSTGVINVTAVYSQSSMNRPGLNSNLASNPFAYAIRGKEAK